MNTRELLQRIREKHKLDKAQPVGVRGSIDTKATVDRPNRLIRATATTDSVDNSREVVIPGGCDWSYLDANKKIFVDHSYGFANVVGSIVNRKPFSTVKANGRTVNGWQILVQVLPLTKNPYTDDLLTIAEVAGIGMSVGFVPLEMGKPTEAERDLYPGAENIIRRWKILEVSFVGMPCNVDCQGGLVQTEEKRSLVLEELVSKSLIRPESARLFGVPAQKENKGIADKPVVRKIVILPSS